MSIRTQVTVKCSHCGVTISERAGALEPCGKNVRGPFNKVDLNTKEVCDGVEIKEENEQGGLCHNCTILEEVERRSTEESEEEIDEEDMEEVEIPYRRY